MSLTMLLSAVVGYVLGSIPFGLVLTRVAGLGDIRKIGSGNIGATNVLRSGNKSLAAATLLLDAFKGLLAVLSGWLIGMLLVGQVAVVPPISDARSIAYAASESANLMPYAMAGGYGAFLGHLFPVWLGFRGGKGVATYIGILLGLFWPAAVIFCATWLIFALALRYSSLSALVAALIAPAAAAVLGEPMIGALLLPLTLLLFYKHSENIRRLIAGEEPKIGAKA
ncbi:MAG: glycerol-3-phosphate 1-O-acyltransferase PlsY [Pseudomonadota bacterium]